MLFYFKPKWLLAPICLLLILQSAKAQVVDPTYIPPFTNNGYVREIVALPDGKVLAAGIMIIAGENNNSQMHLLKFQANGAIDKSFAPGILSSGSIYAIKHLASGKILVGGYFTKYNNTDCNNIIRLNEDGSIDPSFNSGDGLNGAQNYIKDIYELPGGKILLGGVITKYNGVDVNLLAKLNEDGSLDNSFQYTGNYKGRIETIEVQKDSKILIGGGVYDANVYPYNQVLVRLNADGSIDNSFAVTTANVNSINRIKVQDDGKIIVGGDFDSYNNQPYSSIIRLNANGTIDPAFTVGTGFKARYGGVFDYPLDIVSDLYLQADGKIVVSGFFYEYNKTHANGLVRLNSNGTIDQAFWACDKEYELNGIIYGIAASDNKIVVGGSFYKFMNNTKNNYLIKIKSDPGIPPTPSASFDFIIQGKELILNNKSSGATSYDWYFDDYPGSSVSNPIHTYKNPGSYNVTLAANGYCETMNELQKKVSIAELQSFYPQASGNKGTVTIRINGIGFNANSKPGLQSGATKVEAQNVVVSKDGSSIEAVFNLSDITPGNYNLSVANTGTTNSFEQKFVIKEGGESKVYATLSGNDIVRPGRANRYKINFGNKGDMDAYLVPLIISGLPKGAKYKLYANIDTTGLGEDNTLETVSTKDSSYAVPLLLTKLPAHSDFTMDVDLTMPFDVTTVTLSTYTSSPMAESYPLLSLSECKHEIDKTIYERIIDGAADLLKADKCYTAIFKLYLETKYQATLEKGGAFDVMDPNFNQAYTKHLKQTWEMLRDCAIDLFTPERWKKYVEKSMLAIGIFDDFNGNKECIKSIVEAKIRGTKKISVVASYDPNDKTGPSKGDGNFYVTGKEPLSYTIRFENKNTATAPAQEVVVKDTLDTNVFDLSTFSLGSISFGKEQFVKLPVGLSSFSTTVDLRPGKSLLVRIFAKLDTATGVIEWRFTSLDPATLEYTDNPLAGFLPPNVNSPEGEGAVSYSIAMKPGLPQQTALKNKADIFFDQNPPIKTNTFTNILDSIAPVSKMSALPLHTADTTVKLTWKGSDNISGIHSYALFYATTNTPFAIWKAGITDTAVSFIGKADSTYRFFIVAIDKAGNMEAIKSAVEATTTIQPAAQASSYTVSSTSATCKGSNNGKITVKSQTSVSSEALLIKESDSTKHVFTEKTVFENLSTGEYTVCVGPANNKSNCYTLTITEPEDLSVYAYVNPQNHTISLKLSGASEYSIALNNTIYKTTAQNIVLPLEDDITNLNISTNIPCQGIYSERVNASSQIAAYPNPVTETINLACANDVSEWVNIQLYSSTGQILINQKMFMNNGKLKLHVGNIAAGNYVVRIAGKTIAQSIKIMKK